MNMTPSLIQSHATHAQAFDSRPASPPYALAQFWLVMCVDIREVVTAHEALMHSNHGVVVRAKPSFKQRQAKEDFVIILAP
jgi:hypothetical protein